MYYVSTGKAHAYALQYTSVPYLQRLSKDPKKLLQVAQNTCI